MDGKQIKELIDSYTSSKTYQQMRLYWDLYMKNNPNLMKRITMILTIQIVHIITVQ